MAIGIITIHKLHNFGSALQAYALQNFLENAGYDNQIIDYHWTWEYYNPNTLQYLFIWMKKWGKLLLQPNTSWSRFVRFRRDFFNLTAKEYTKYNIGECPPKYDLYITGSDQVWNCKFTDGDPNFLLQFTPDNAKRISYASSFATSKLPDKYKEIFQELLYRYDSISVREESGVNIVEELTGKEAKVVCDPTLLLADNDYSLLADKSAIHIDGKYILVYILDYMYNPYPHINGIIEKVVGKLNEYKVVFINNDLLCEKFHNSINVKDAGPCEFLHLMQNASFIITTSFHGTAFAAIFHKPLLSVVQDQNTDDGRCQTLLKKLHQNDSIISCKEIPSETLIMSDSIICNDEYLTELRNHSRRILLDMIKND